MLMNHVSLVQYRDVEESIEIPSEEADDESLPPKKKKKPGPLTKLLEDLLLQRSPPRTLLIMPGMN